MSRIRRSFRGAFLLWICVTGWHLGTSSAAGQVQAIAMKADRWIVGKKNFKLKQREEFGQNGEVVDYLGRPSLRLSKGFAFVRDLEFQNGTIEVDMAPHERGQFLGISFRVQSEDDYELIFFRPGASGTTQAVQYTPGLNGANSWQIYTGPGYSAAADIPRSRWTHVRIVVTGLVAKLYLNGETEPVLVVPELRLNKTKGSIGFWAHAGGGYFSNLTYEPDAATYDVTAKRNFVPGALTDWSLSDLFDPSKNDPASYPDVKSMKWEKAEAENPGMVVLNRYRRSPNINPPGRDEQIRGRSAGAGLVFARTTIHSEKDEIRKMNFGYSDSVVVYLNGKPVYNGNNAIAFREPDQLGLLDADSEGIYLPLKKGDNELLLAVTEYFGGWGFICKLAEQ